MQNLCPNEVFQLYAISNLKEKFNKQYVSYFHPLDEKLYYG